MARPYDFSTNPMKVVRNVEPYALWPTAHTPHGYTYLWACGHTGPMPHVCPKGPNRATLFEAPDLRLVRPAWTLAERFIARHKLQEATAGEAMAVARRRVGGRRIA